MCLAATNACVPIVAARPTRRLPFCFAPFLFAIRRAHTHKKRVGGLGHPCLGYIYIHGHAARIGFGPKRRDDGGGDCWSQEEILGKVVKI